MRKAIVEKLRKGGATADVASDESDDAVSRASGDPNPNHLKDFTRLVDLAAKKKGDA